MTNPTDDQTRVTPDGDGFLLHLPEVTSVDTQVWAVDIGLTAGGLRRLRDALAVPLPSVDRAADELTAEEARALADDLGLKLYRAEDALAFVGECCNIADREQRPITTADVREWLKGARCGRQLATDAVLPEPAPTTEQAAEVERLHATIERARTARRRITSALIAVESHLITPYPDDPRWTPWTRFVEPALKGLTDALRAEPDTAELRRLADETQPTGHQPRRSDQFEAWLKAQRDEHRDTGRGVWTTLDNLLDLYRLHADAGTRLDEHVCEGQAVGDCECLEQPAAGARQDGAQ